MNDAASTSDRAKTSDRAILYEGYEVWKGWNRLFTVSPDEELYFAGETDGLRIANADVFEIGFGSGSFLAWARKRGARVAGTEINEALIDSARAFDIELLPADFETVAERYTSRFDTIAGFDVFEHFTHAEIAARLRALETMLKPDGHLILRFPNAQSPFGLAPQNGDLTHKTSLSRGVFEQLIQCLNFDVVRYAPCFRVIGGTMMKRLKRILRSTARDLISRLLNAIYTQDIPWDPVVVLVMKKRR
jgi:SAM-dependent methyltransferase